VRPHHDARQAGVGPALLRASVVTGILTGRHPPALTARKLMADTRLPLAWNEQRTVLGFR